MTSRTDDSTVDALREWARGCLPLMAAVDFLVATGTDLGPMVREREFGGLYLDLELDDDQWADRVGYMSSGQRATWELARSMVDMDGELNRWFWRLDSHRKLALTSALTSTIVTVSEDGRWQL